MIILGEEIIKQKLLGNIIFDHQVQPAGVDLTIKSIESFEEGGIIDGDNTKRYIPKTKPINWGKEEKIHLMPGAYKIIFNEIISVPADAIAIAQSRSSLLRSGAATINAIWDPGYSGRSEGLLVVFNPAGLTIYKNAKVLQLVFIKLEKSSSTLYSGRYQNENK
jgi:dUTP pyrophosphatase